MLEIVPDDKLLRRIEWANAILLVALSLVAWWMVSIRAGIGIMLGGLIASTSFQALKWQLRKAFRPGNLPQKGGLLVTFYLRFLGTLFLVFVVMHYGWADPIALLVGLSVVILSILTVGGFEFLKMLSKKGDS